EVFEIVPGSFDPHMDKSGKPPELQIKIRQKRNNLRRFFNDNGRPDLFDAFYAPDTSELQLYSASGGALKYLTPGVDPLAYKHRSMERQLPDRVAWKYYTSFYTVLQRISPVKETIGEERAAIHAGNIRNNMIAAAARDFSSFPPLLEEAVRMLKDQNMFKYY
ncbi:MAG: hypothetical protein HGA85_06250, partial [Nanoarchaeota archaeon]|nr:hypothetical protein [Nanoarchaeota archaeon]